MQDSSAASEACSVVPKYYIKALLAQGVSIFLHIFMISSYHTQSRAQSNTHTLLILVNCVQILNPINGTAGD